MKELFFDKSKWESHKNIEINFNELKKENTIYTNTEPHEGFFDGYFTVIRDPQTRKVGLYYRSQKDRFNYHHGGFTCYSESDDGITFTKPKFKFYKQNGKKNNIILNEICASHNFSPFYDINTNTYKAVGGQHLFDIHFKKNHEEIYFHQKCKSLTKIYYDKTICWGLHNKKGSYVDSSINHPCRCNGLYGYESTDGVKWKLIQDTPIITGFHPGHNDILHGIATYDSLMSCLYNKQKDLYFLYSRANVGKQERYIQYTTSKDFINWEPMKLIKMDPKYRKGDNYYISNFFQYPDSNIFMSILPYFNKLTCKKKGGKIYLFHSKDATTWKRCSKLFSTGGFNGLVQKIKNNCQPVNNIIISNDSKRLYVYIHENFYGYYPGKPTYVDRYSIRLDGFSSVKSKNGYFITIP